jgi:phytanoyl-CoA hydroxylase
MFATTTPLGRAILVPDGPIEDHAYFTAADLDGAARFYAAEGYVVVRGLVPPGLCDRVRGEFDREVRFSRTAVLRQQDMRYERNRFDRHGFLANPIFNIQDLETRRFGGFKRAALDLLTQGAVMRVIAALLAGGRPPEPAKLIQSMFFEGGVGTWPHQDSYYQDSAAELGGCAAGWFALEDVAAGAGRFYVLARSHRETPVIRNEGALDFASGHERYKRAVLAAAAEHALEWRVPWLGKGDVLFWSSRTIHGSLRPDERCVASRASLTAHYLREGDAMLQFHARIRVQKMMRHNGVAVGRLHDQDEWRNRLARFLAAHCPAAWALARRAAIQAVLRGAAAGRAVKALAGVASRRRGPPEAA